MLVLDKNVMTIDIPKTGCQTRWAIGLRLNRYEGLRANHLPLSIAQKFVNTRRLRGETEYWTVIRNPVDRLVSAANYSYMVHFRRNQIDLTFDEFVETRPDKSFYPPHHHFLDAPVPVKLWPFESQGDMLKQLGWDGDIPHLNSSPKKWTAEEIQSSKYYQTLMNQYEPDWQLYDFALQTRGSEHWINNV